MLTILNKTPITFNGVDCFEVLVKDDCMNDSVPCELCMYRNYAADNELFTDCCTVHGCGIDFDTYFIIQDL